MQRKGSFFKGICIVVLSAVFVGQYAGSEAKVKKSKLRSTTGIIQSLDSGNTLIMNLGKKGIKKYSLNKNTVVIREISLNKDQLSENDIVRIKGKGIGDEIIVSKLTRLDSQEFKFSKKIKKGNAYSDVLKNTEIKGKIFKLKPLTISNRSNQSIVLVVGEKAKLVKEEKISIDEVSSNIKATVLYRMINDDLLIELIFLPIQTIKEAKKL